MKELWNVEAREIDMKAIWLDQIEQAKQENERIRERAIKIKNGEYVELSYCMCLDTVEDCRKAYKYNLKWIKQLEKAIRELC